MSKKKRIAKASSIETRIIRYMTELGTYKVEFSDMIKIYADMLREYQVAKQQFIIEGGQYEVETAAGGTKKSGTVSALEVLRKDISAYSDKLMLNPKSLDSVQPVNKETDVLSTIFDKFESDN